MCISGPQPEHVLGWGQSSEQKRWEKQDKREQREGGGGGMLLSCYDNLWTGQVWTNLVVVHGGTGLSREGGVGESVSVSESTVMQRRGKLDKETEKGTFRHGRGRRFSSGFERDLAF